MSSLVLLIGAILAELYLILCLFLILKFRSLPSIKFRYSGLLILQTLIIAFIVCVFYLWLYFRQGKICLIVRLISSAFSPIFSTTVILRLLCTTAKYHSGANAERQMRLRDRLPQPIPLNSELGISAEEEAFSMINFNREQLTVEEPYQALEQPTKIRSAEALSAKLGNQLGKIARRLTKTNLVLAIALVGLLGTVSFVINENLHFYNGNERFCNTASRFESIFSTICIIVTIVLCPVIFYTNDTYGISIELCCFLVIWVFGIAILHSIRFIGGNNTVEVIYLTIWHFLALHWITAGMPLLEVIAGLW